MHLICLKVVKKLILLWMQSPHSVRLNAKSINKISHLLILLKNTTPVDFVRIPRSITNVKQWKVTKFRNFILYIIPVVFEEYICKRNYIIIF